MTGVLTLTSNAKDHGLTPSAERLGEFQRDQDLVDACPSVSLSAFEQLFRIHSPKGRFSPCAGKNKVRWKN
jgi:hypothetical protein